MQDFLLARSNRRRDAAIRFQPRGMIVCLCCGETRAPFGGRFLAECPACSYLGWADSATLSEAERRLLSDGRRLTVRRRDARGRLGPASH
jgi:hypothetical protein